MNKLGNIAGTIVRRIGSAIAETVSAIYAAVNFIWTTILIIAICAAAYVFIFGGSSSDTSSRTYEDNPAPVEFDFGALDIRESTAAPGLNEAQRIDRMRRSVIFIFTEQGLGSGVLLDNQRCLAVTNAHVVAMTGDLKARVITRIRANGETVDRVVDLEVLGRPSGADDLAIVRLSECNNMPWAPLGDSDRLVAGQPAYGVGQPLGLDWTVTRGIISNPARVDPEYTGNSGYPLIQMDVDINPGNSGGGLFTPNGALVGINSMGILEANGLNFARSSNLLAAYIGRLASDGRVYERSLGVMTSENPDGSLTIVDVRDGSRAAHVGLRAGDVLLAVNNQRVDGNHSFVRGIYSDTDGVVDIAVRRTDGLYTLTIDYNQERSGNTDTTSAEPIA